MAEGNFDEEFQQLEERIQLAGARLTVLKARVAALETKSNRCVRCKEWISSAMKVSDLRAERVSARVNFWLEIVPAENMLLEYLGQKIREDFILRKHWCLENVFSHPPEHLIDLLPPWVFFTHPMGLEFVGSLSTVPNQQIGFWRPLGPSQSVAGSQGEGIVASVTKYECRGYVLKLWRLTSSVDGGKNGWMVGVMERSRPGPRDRILQQPSEPRGPDGADA